MQRRWRHGSFAELAHYRAQSLTVLPNGAQMERTLLPFLASLAIADDGLRRGRLPIGFDLNQLHFSKADSQRSV